MTGGDGYSLAIKTDGSLWAWGRNGDGLGYIKDTPTLLTCPTSPVNTIGSIDISTAPAGIFLIKFFEKGKTHSARVVKE